MAHCIPSLIDKHRPSISMLGKRRILYTSRGKNQGIYKESVIKVAYGFLTGILEARRQRQSSFNDL